jgi:hypothetical protein
MPSCPLMAGIGAGAGGDGRSGGSCRQVLLWAAMVRTGTVRTAGGRAGVDASSCCAMGLKRNIGKLGGSAPGARPVTTATVAVAAAQIQILITNLLRFVLTPGLQGGCVALWVGNAAARRQEDSTAEPCAAIGGAANGQAQNPGIFLGATDCGAEHERFAGEQGVDGIDECTPDAAQAAFRILGSMEFACCVIVATEVSSAVNAAGDWRRAAVVLALTLPVTAVLLYAWRRLRETTLIVPLVWAAITFGAAMVLTLWSAMENSAPTSDFAAWQLVTACGTLCPLVALVGAKRPHHGAWSLVVVTLWGLLALPAAEVLFLQPGQALEINSLRSWFLVVLLLAELASFAFTRYGPAMLLLTAGQVCWLLLVLPLIPETWKAATEPVARQWTGFWLVCAAIVLAWILAQNRRRSATPLDQLWFDFRDSFGLFWALKLIERVNDTAEQAEWGFDLGWTGFRTKTDFVPLIDVPPEIAGPLRNSLQGLLRRFVSEEWIASEFKRQ